jgi:rod shape-determining protein MreB
MAYMMKRQEKGERKNFWENFGQDIAIDLGTANTLVYIKNKGIVINEPSVVALNINTGQILAIGNEAKMMVGRTPAHIVATRPLVDGVVSDYEVTEQMLKYFIGKVAGQTIFHRFRSRVIVGIPSGVTEVEKRAVYDATKAAGVKDVFLIEEPIAAAVGSRLPIQDATGSIIVDVGGGTTEIAVISLGGVVVSNSLRVAGDRLNDDIIRYVRNQYKLVIGERTAENVKIHIGSVYPLSKKFENTIKGRDVVTGLPKEVVISNEDVQKAISGSVRVIVSSIKEAIEKTPPELIGDIMDRGVILAGGGGLLRGLDKLVQEVTLVPCYVTNDPLTSVVRGAGMVLENLDSLKNVLVPLDVGRKPRY